MRDLSQRRVSMGGAPCPLLVAGGYTGRGAKGEWGRPCPRRNAAISRLAWSVTFGASARGCHPIHIHLPSRRSQRERLDRTPDGDLIDWLEQQDQVRLVDHDPLIFLPHLDLLLLVR